MTPKVSIIILNRNWRQDTIECLESVYRIDYPNYEVILVDNGSSNESIEKIKDWTQKHIEVSSKYFETTTCTHDLTIYEYTKEELENGSYLEGKKRLDPLPSNKKLFLLKNDQNYGFAEGNNIAMRQVLSESSSEYVLLLNNDTVVDKAFLSHLVADASTKSDLGMIAPVNYNYYNWSIDFYGGAINRRLGRPYHLKTPNNQKSYQFLTGCCLLIPLDIIRITWWFDPIYFCYFEDADLSQKIQCLWKKLYICITSKITHKIGASSWKKSKFYRYYFSRNRLIFNKKYNKSPIKILHFLMTHLLIKSTLLLTTMDYHQISWRYKWIYDWLHYINKN